MGARRLRHCLLLFSFLLAVITLPRVAAEGEQPVKPLSRADWPTPRFYDDVPREHWLYDACQQLASLGFSLNYPEETLQGRRAYTWGQMAGFFAEMMESGAEVYGAGLPDRYHYLQKYHVDSAPTRLAQELAPELAALKLDTPLFRQRLEKIVRLLKDGRPLGVTVPIVRYGYGPKYNPTARARGARLADAEWEHGEAVLYLERTSSVDLKLGQTLQYRKLTKKELGPDAKEVIAGHNEALWHHLWETGPRKELPWLLQVFDLARTWRAEGHKSLRLDRRHPGAVLPGSQLQLVWDLEPPGGWVRRHHNTPLPDGRLLAERQSLSPTHRLVIDNFPWGESTLQVPGFPPKFGTFHLLWGPAGSGIVFFRTKADDREKPVRLYAVDLQTGCLLNAGAFTEQEVRPDAKASRRTESPPPHPDYDVPAEHWLYEAFYFFNELGVGKPFIRPPVSRFSFQRGKAARHFAEQVVEASLRVPVTRLPRNLVYKWDKSRVKNYELPAKTAAELEPELRVLGLDTPRFRHGLRNLEAILRHQPPIPDPFQ